MITPTDQYITTPIEPSDESSGEHLMGGFKRNPVRSLVKKTFQFCVSVRTITIFILLISVITIALIVWGLGFRGAQQTVTSLVNVLRNEAMERAMGNFDNFFTQSEDIVESATAQYWANFQDLQYVEDDNNTVTAIKGFLYSTLLPNTRYINSLNWIRKDGAMISFSYEAGAKPYEYTYSYSSTRYGYVKGFFDPSYPSQPFEQTITSITAFRNQTQRIPTYAVAVQKAPEKGMFSELSPHASDPWISVSSIAKPYRKRSDGSLIGTVNAVFYLQSIKQMVVDVNPTDYGFVVVMQDDGKIVGDSTPFLAHTNGPCGTNNTTILKLCRLINDTGDSNFALGIARFRSGVFEASGVKLRVVKETITRGLLNWHVFIGLSNDEFEGPVQKFSRTAIWVTAIITVAAMLVGALVLFVLLNSLNQMAKCFTYIQKLELDSKLIRNTLERNSIVYEVRALESNFKSMVSAMKSFQKYIPRAVVADLVHHQKEAKLGLIKTNCTVFFMDIADFTTISEQLSPEVLVEVMCEVFNMASRTIVENGGVIDKYIGDCIMAFWNAPNKVKHHESKAVRASLEIQHQLIAHEKSLIARGHPVLRARIGMTSGNLMVGNFGSDERIQYTVIGDTVNLASRIEGINKVYGTSICISESLFLAAHSQPGWTSICRKLDFVAVKGKNTSVLLYEVMLFEENERFQLLGMVAEYHKAFDLYLAGKFEEARDIFSELQLQRKDPVLQFKIEQCTELIENPPANWDGTVVMTEK